MIDWKGYWISSLITLAFLLVLSLVTMLMYPSWIPALVSLAVWAVMQPVIILVIWILEVTL